MDEKKVCKFKQMQREGIKPNICSLLIFRDAITAPVCWVRSHVWVADAFGRVKPPSELCQIQFLAHLVAAFRPIIQCVFKTLAIQSPLRLLSPPTSPNTLLPIFTAPAISHCSTIIQVRANEWLRGWEWVTMSVSAHVCFFFFF